MKWREEWSINKDDGWTPPQVLVDYIPSGLTGYDKEGSPVVVVPFAGFDVCGLLKSVSPKDMIRFLAQKVDSYIEIARLSSLKHGPKASQVNCIVDLTDFNLRQFTWRPGNHCPMSYSEQPNLHEQSLCIAMTSRREQFWFFAKGGGNIHWCIYIKNQCWI